jgi:hypothetical protein
MTNLLITVPDDTDTDAVRALYAAKGIVAEVVRIGDMDWPRLAVVDLPADVRAAALNEAIHIARAHGRSAALAVRLVLEESARNAAPVLSRFVDAAEGYGRAMREALPRIDLNALTRDPSEPVWHDEDRVAELSRLGTGRLRHSAVKVPPQRPYNRSRR